MGRGEHSVTCAHIQCEENLAEVKGRLLGLEVSGVRAAGQLHSNSGGPGLPGRARCLIGIEDHFRTESRKMFPAP